MPQNDTDDPFVYPPHALRLGGREWLVALGIVITFVLIVPRAWIHVETLETGGEDAVDYRVPYALSDDYWLYARHLDEAAARDENAIFAVGDSVIWGEYVARDGTLSHFLTAHSAASGTSFVNAGVNGLFPLALEGLIRDFGGALRGRKVLLHANLLWMTSPEADLSTSKERTFNHESLVPQFAVSIPCYRAKTERRLGHLAGRKIGVLGWSKHLDICYFDQLGIPQWTLEPGNAYRNPLAAVTRRIPGEPVADPDRGESSERHRPWSEDARSPQLFEWVSPDASLQWAAFRRLVELLRMRDNDLLVVIGPLNEHMIAGASRPAFENWSRELRRWLDKEGIPMCSPTPLASALYGDASHPLTEGYRTLARQIAESPEGKRWLQR